jgi:hypothetical protein
VAGIRLPDLTVPPGHIPGLESSPCLTGSPRAICAYVWRYDPVGANAECP